MVSAISTYSLAEHAPHTQSLTELRALAHEVLQTEAAAVSALADRLTGSLGDALFAAVNTIIAAKGRVVVSGMGKSGHVAGKIAATLASTGTPAFFMHPAEASHGDLGMITADDVVIAISYGGESDELMAILPLVKRRGVPVIAMTGKPMSSLAKMATVSLDVAVDREACPLNLAPTASTTATLALGDALAVALLDARGFTSHDFALHHPGGALGRRLLLQVRDVMHSGSDLPQVLVSATLMAAVAEMSSKGLGLTAVVDASAMIVGLFTDGDLRRAIERVGDVRPHNVADFMTRTPRTIAPDCLAAEAAQLLQHPRPVAALLVAEPGGPLVGVIHVNDLMRSGVI